jgi:hypothetical protein
VVCHNLYKLSAPEPVSELSFVRWQAAVVSVDCLPNSKSSSPVTPGTAGDWEANAH